VWKTLFRTHQILKHRPYFNDLNPKAVTNDELFGIINPSTREWKDGILSILMRDQANLTGDGPKWIILDGDIDPMWIESLNTGDFLGNFFISTSNLLLCSLKLNKRFNLLL
jgi:dynein heavy chain